MKERLRRIVSSQYMVLPVFLLKLVIYYILIDVNILRNPWVLASILVFASLYFLLSNCRWKGHRVLFLMLYTGFSILMFADSMYFNYYNQTISVKQLWQAANVAKVPQSFIATLIPASFILILDIPVVYYLFRKREQAKSKVLVTLGKGAFCLACVLVILLLAVNPGEYDLFSKINSVEFFSNHIRDVYLAAAEPLQEDELPEAEVLESVGELTESPEILEEVVEEVQETVEKSPEMAEEYEESLEELEEMLAEGESSADVRGRGLAKGRNLILVQVEALQSMMLQSDYEGQELMPNLNRLLEQDTLYFDHYYTVIGKGNTADAEFATLNSLYPVIDRECYNLYQTNTYDGLPWMLREQGYSTFAVHGYLGDFWGRNYAYPYQGMEEYYSIEDLDDSDQIGLGISDISMFRQAVMLMKDRESPFFSFLVTLTNHHPYELPEELCEISLKEEHQETKFGKHLQTVHYTDDAIGVLLEELKAAGLYENSVIVFYGDHHGLNKNMDDNDIYVSEWLGHEYDYDEMFRVPLVIHIPGMGYAETISTVGSQVDFLPTIANLMDLELDHPYILGRDLYNVEEGFAAFTVYMFEGSFVKDGVMFEISREGLFEGSRAWEIGTGRELDIEPFYEDYEKAVKLKTISTEILEQDLISGHVRHEVIPYEPPEETAVYERENEKENEDEKIVGIE